MVEGTSPRRSGLKIADLADSNGYISGRAFVDREVIGPAVLGFASGTPDIQECAFPGPIEHFVWLAPDHPVMGIVGLVDCSFLRCTFTHTVGFIGSAEFRAAFLRDLLR